MKLHVLQCDQCRSHSEPMEKDRVAYGWSQLSNLRVSGSLNVCVFISMRRLVNQRQKRRGTPSLCTIYDALPRLTHHA
jgi:hypothetical protein